MSDVWKEALPDSDPIGQAESESALREHAHLIGVYYKALIEAGLPETLAGTLIEEFSSDVLSAAGDEEGE